MAVARITLPRRTANELASRCEALSGAAAFGGRDVYRTSAREARRMALRPECRGEFTEYELELIVESRAFPPAAEAELVRALAEARESAARERSRNARAFLYAH